MMGNWTSSLSFFEVFGPKADDFVDCKIVSCVFAKVSGEGSMRGQR